MSRKMFFCIVIALLCAFVLFLVACGAKNKQTATIGPSVIPVTQPQVNTQTPTKPTATTAPAATTPPTATPVSVAILVVDDFIIESRLGDIPTPPPDVTGTITGCVYTSDGQQAYSSTGAQAYSSTGASIPVDDGGNPVPHGKLVYDQIYNDITGLVTATLQTSITDTGISWITGPIDHWNLNNNSEKIYLVPVDTSNYKTTAVTERINQAINTLSNPGYLNINRFVLNMSFVIMPCNPGYDLTSGTITDTQSLVKRYRELINSTNEIKDLEETLNKFANSDNVLIQPEATVRNALLFGPEFGPVRILNFYDQKTLKIFEFEDKKFQFISNDVLIQWLRALPDAKEGPLVISVAAAGNYGYVGYDMPFAPGLFDSVVSVSAMGWDPLDPKVIENGSVYTPGATYNAVKTRYSNPGEVMFDGKLGYSIINTAGKEVYYFGTSFAAPRLSVQEAFYLLHGGMVSCRYDGPGHYSTPALGYSQGFGPWDNLPLATAIPTYCPRFRNP